MTVTTFLKVLYPAFVQSNMKNIVKTLKTLHLMFIRHPYCGI